MKLLIFLFIIKLYARTNIFYKQYILHFPRFAHPGFSIGTEFGEVRNLALQVLSLSMDVSYSSDEENLNVESSDDLDYEVENFTGYGNEPEYTRSRKFLNKLILSVVP